MKTFGMKTVIHFGDNALDRLREIPYKRVLIITDPFVVQSKMIDLITEPLAKGGIEYDIFSNVVPDAPVDKIADGVKKKQLSLLAVVLLLTLLKQSVSLH